MLTGRDVVVIASVDWTPLWQTPQEVASRLAAAGNRVLYVENTGVRMPGLRDARRVVQRLRNWRRAPGGRDEQPGLRVYSPLVLPPFGPGVARALNRIVLLKRVRREAKRMGMRDPIVWTWLPTDTALDLASLLELPTCLLVYFCIADFAPLTPQRRRLEACERELLRRADLVFAHTEPLRERFAAVTRRAELFPPAVSLDRFPQAPVPAALPDAPTIGYVGGVHRFVDLDLVAACARARPDWRWVLVGPIQRSTAPVDGLPNVELRGPRPHAELGSIIATFDVCVVPYLHGPQSATIAPTKISEYLAVGRPVVATDLPWVVDFQERHGVLEVVAGTPDSFVRGIDSALATSTDAGLATARRAVAELSDWSTRLERASQLIAQLEAPRATATGAVAAERRRAARTE